MAATLSVKQIKLAHDLYHDGYKLKSFKPNGNAVFIKGLVKIKLIAKEIS